MDYTINGMLVEVNDKEQQAKDQAQTDRLKAYADKLSETQKKDQ